MKNYIIELNTISALKILFINSFYLILLFQLLIVEFSLAQDKDHLKKDFVRMGALTNTVVGVELKDADAAFKIWTDVLVKKFKAKNVYDFTFEYKMYENIGGLKNDIKTGLINYFNVPTQDYFYLNLGSDFIPFLSGTNHPKQKFTHYYLVTSSNNKIKDLKELVSKKVNISKSIIDQIGAIWLKTVLRDEMGARLYKSVNLQTVNNNENEDLLAVFFNKTDYALVSQSTFDLASELNPSLLKKVQIIRSSGNLVTGLFVYRKGMNSNTIKVIKDIVSDLHNDNEGRQILNLFKISKIIPIDKDDLTECEKVINKYNKYFK